MATKIPTPVLKSTSFYVEINPCDSSPKETVRLTFQSRWRGQDVLVYVDADRYTASFYAGDDDHEGSKRLTDWRCYAESARPCSPEGERDIRAADLSSTAKSALGAACQPLALAWLTGPEGETARRTAYGNAVKRLLGNDRGFYTSRARAALAAHSATLTPEDFTYLGHLCDRVDEVHRWMGQGLPSETPA